jgi:hypothetical protein
VLATRTSELFTYSDIALFVSHMGFVSISRVPTSSSLYTLQVACSWVRDTSGWDLLKSDKWLRRSGCALAVLRVYNAGGSAPRKRMKHRKEQTS